MQSDARGSPVCGVMLPSSGPRFQLFLWVLLDRVGAQTSAGSLADRIGTRFLENSRGTGPKSTKTAENDASDHRLLRSGFGTFGTLRESASHHVEPEAPNQAPKSPGVLLCRSGSCAHASRMGRHAAEFGSEVSVVPVGLAGPGWCPDLRRKSS